MEALRPQATCNAIYKLSIAAIPVIQMDDFLLFQQPATHKIQALFDILCIQLKFNLTILIEIVGHQLNIHMKRCITSSFTPLL